MKKEDVQEILDIILFLKENYNNEYITLKNLKLLAHFNLWDFKIKVLKNNKVEIILTDNESNHSFNEILDTKKTNNDMEVKTKSFIKILNNFYLFIVIKNNTSDENKKIKPLANKEYYLSKDLFNSLIRYNPPFGKNHIPVLEKILNKINISLRDESIAFQHKNNLISDFNLSGYYVGIHKLDLSIIANKKSLTIKTFNENPIFDKLTIKVLN